jgi:A/G-specific adenine glycosylase
MVRGKLMAVLREAPGSVSKTRLDQVWPDGEQRERALATLVDDGLAYITTERRYSLSPD